MAEAVPSAVLTAVARLVADAPALRDVIGRVAVTLRDSIPFDRLHLLRLDRAESFVLYVADPFGHQWFLATRKENISPQEMQKRFEKSYK